MSLTLEQVRWVAHLARLDLGEAELETMTRQISAILEYVDQLQKINTDHVEPLAHPLPIPNVFRDDEPAPSLPVDDALQNAPDRRGDFYGVPAVLDS
jgi:aspartyl-tRNA(Asn)/glutamyl-tRNA(Gln) amidotransferase subunit C